MVSEAPDVVGEGDDLGGVGGNPLYGSVISALAIITSSVSPSLA